MILIALGLYYILRRKNLLRMLKKEVAEAEKEIEDVKKLEEKIRKTSALEEKVKKESERLAERLRGNKNEDKKDE